MALVDIKKAKWKELMNKPILTEHQDCDKTLKGSLRVMKENAKGNNWEFKCDACEKGYSFMDTASAPEGYMPFIKQYEKKRGK